MLLPLLQNVFKLAYPDGISSGEAFGTGTLDINLAPSGIATAEGVGTPNMPTVNCTGIASTEAFGTVRLALILAPTGIATAEGFGSIGFVGVLLFPTGIATAEDFGTPSVASIATETTLLTGYSTSHKPQVAEYKHLGYVNNGWDRLVRWDGRAAAAAEAGIAGPDTAVDSWTPAPTEAAGSCTEGLHLVRYRFLDSITGYVSNPSEEREVEVTSGNGQLTFPISTSGATNIIRSTDSKVDKIVVEMTTVDGTVFYQAAEVTNDSSSVVVDINDPSLEVSFLAWPDRGHDVPPIAKNIVSHRERIWLFGQVVHSTGLVDVTNGSNLIDAGSTDPDWRASALGDSTVAPQVDFKSVAWSFVVSGDPKAYDIDTYDAGNNQLQLVSNYTGTTATDKFYQIFSRANVIWVSEPGYPESFSPLKFLAGPAGEGTGDITAGVGYSSSMIFFSHSSMFKLSWDEGPLVDSVVIPISNKYGALNQAVVIEVEGTVYSMDRRGWTAWRGVFPKFISKPINSLRASIDYTKSEEFHAVFFSELRAIRWYVVYSGSTYPKNYVQLDIDTGVWSTGTMYHSMRASRLVPTVRGLEVFLGDTSGHLWIGDTGNADGVESAFTHLTSRAGATTTVIPISGATLPNVGSRITGCYAYHVTAREARLITSNTATQITVGTAFSSAPASGDTIWIGPIPSKLKTRAFSARRRGEKTQTRYLWLEYNPLDSERTLLLRVYEDLSDTAKTWATSRNAPNPGVAWPGSDSEYLSTDWLLDMSESDGNLQIPIGSEFKRYFELEFEIEEPDAPIEILSIEYDERPLEDDQ